MTARPHRTRHAAASPWSRGQALLRVLRAELALVVALGLLAGAATAFLLVASEVVEGETRAADRWILLALRDPLDPSDPLGPRWLEEMVRDVTALGGTTIVTMISLAVCGWLLLGRRLVPALVVGASVTGSIALSLVLKAGFARPRPELVSHATEVYTASFPSGHAMLSASAYLTLGALLAQVQPHPRLKVYILSVAVALTMLVGASRVYLGVHWPSDVLAGWCAGAAWAIACWLASLRIQRRAATTPP